jgi:carbamate kinase
MREKCKFMLLNTKACLNFLHGRDIQEERMGPMLVTLALGGNAILRRDQKGTFDEQYQNVCRTSVMIADLVEKGYKVVITHGNGPQVGASLLRHDAAKQVIPPFPLDACGAETQGFIGYMIQQGLRNELKRRGLDITVVAMVTRVIVDRNDSAFQNKAYRTFLFEGRG